MSNPYDPATIYFDTLPVLEFFFGGGAAWPGNGAELTSSQYDLADMLPASYPNNNLTMFPPADSSRNPDPRFFLDWYMWFEQEPTSAIATDPMAIMFVRQSAGGDFETQPVFVVSCHGPGARISYAPNGAASDSDRHAMKGSVRLTARAFNVSFRVFGNAPSNCALGAYLRVI